MTPLLSKPHMARWGAWAFAFVFSALYLATRTWAFSYDAFTAVLTTERNGTFPFHPNHLFGNGLGWLFFKGLSLTSGPARALFVFQTVNAVIAGMAVGYFFYLLAVRFSLRAGILGSTGLGLSYAFWSEAVDAGAYASAGLCAVALTGALLQFNKEIGKERRSIEALTTGLLLGAGILVHQMFLLAIPAFLILLGASPVPSVQEKVRPPLFFLIGVFLAGIVPYAVIARFYYGFGIREGLFWFLGPAGPRPNSGILVNSWWQWKVFQNVPPLWHGLAESIAAPLSSRLEWVHWVGQGGVAIGLLILSVGSLRLFFRNPEKRPMLVAVFAWILAMNGFQFFWAPGIIRFRILFLPALIVWIFIAREGLPEMAPKRDTKRVLLFLCLILAIGLSNALGKILPATRLENNRDIVRSLWANQTMGQKDFFLFAGSGNSIMNVVPPYFAPRVPSRSLYGYFFGNPQGDFSEIAMTIDHTLRNGGTVHIEEQLFRKESWAGLAPNETITQILSQWFSQYQILSLLNGPSCYSVAKIRHKTASHKSPQKF